MDFNRYNITGGGYGIVCLYESSLKIRNFFLTWFQWQFLYRQITYFTPVQFLFSENLKCPRQTARRIYWIISWYWSKTLYKSQTCSNFWTNVNVTKNTQNRVVWHIIFCQHFQVPIWLKRVKIVAVMLILS